MDKSKVLDQLQNKQLESEVLGAILSDSDLFPNIEHQSIELFYYKPHQTVFKAMKEVAKSEQAIDILTVTMAAREIDDKITLTYITELSSEVISTANFETHLNMLVDYHNKRNIFQAMQTIDYANTSEDIGNELYKLLDKMLVSQEDAKTTKESLADYITDLYEPEADNGLKLGLRTIDNKIGGLKPGQLMTIAGYTGMGKSILTSQIILNMLRKNVKVDLFTLEMPRAEIFDKLNSNGCSIEFNKFLTKSLSDKEKDQVMEFTSMVLAEKDFEIYEFIDDINKIVNQVKKDKLKGKVDIVFIDLINRVTDSTSKDGNRASFISSITRKLKLLAGKLGIPIVITAQINRTVESRQDKRPTLADVKESGGIAEDSDYVIGVYRNKELERPEIREQLNNSGKLSYNTKDADFNPECIEISMLKGRNVNSFTAAFFWSGKHQRVGNMEM